MTMKFSFRKRKKKVFVTLFQWIIVNIQSIRSNLSFGKNVMKRMLQIQRNFLILLKNCVTVR